MNKTKRTVANLPVDLLNQAMRVTGNGITETLVEGLELVRRTRAFKLVSRLKGQVDFDLDIDLARERTRRR